MSKINIEKSKRESSYRKSSNRNQNTGGSTPGTASSITIGDRPKRATIDIDGKRLTITETAILKTKLDKEELREYKREMAELQLIWDKNIQQMKDLNLAKIVQAKWDRYMRCDGSPDPVDQKEINTYISLRQEDKSRDDADSILNDSQLDLLLIEELNILLLNSSSEVLCEEERILYQKTIENLQKLIMSKLDLATLQVMRDATVLANKETGNLQHAVMIKDIALCVWGNIMKNPRIRSHEFPEINFTFDIPRIIALSDCAIRILTTKFDPYSPTCKTIIPRVKKVAEPELIEVESQEEKKEQGDEQDEEDEEKKNKEQKDEAVEEREDSKFNLVSVRSSEVLKEDMDGQEEAEQEQSDNEYQDPPTPEPVEWEDFDEDEDVVDLRAWTVQGCVYHFNLLQLPPQPKFVGSWTITQLVDPPEICYLEYTSDSAGHEVSRDSRKDEKPAININVVFPSDTLFIEQPLVAHWDYERKLWSADGVIDLTYNEEARMISFKTMQFGTFCLLQDTHINMPFQSWEIRPHKLNSALFIIRSNFIEVQIEIKDEFCCLSGPKNKPELNSILNKWVTPAELFVMMKKAGVNFFPNEDSVKFVSISNKHPVIEGKIYQQMAMTASAMAYSWSKWNSKIGESNEIIFHGVEALEDEPILEERWSVFMATKRRVMQLKLTELEDSFSDDFKKEDRLISEEESLNLSEDEGLMRRTSSRGIKNQHTMRRASVMKAGIGKRMKVKEESKTPKELFLEIFNVHRSPYRSNIYHLMHTFASENAISRVNNTSFQFVDCVHKLLTTTKVLTYC